MATNQLAQRVVAAVERHPAVREIRLVGSRATGQAQPESDWDFRVDVEDFEAVANALPELCAPLQPLAQQWDRLSDEQCWMLILRGPTKVDLLFPEEPHQHEPPWQPSARNLDAIDAHFWDWMLWLRGKEATGKHELVAAELQKLFDHLLHPVGVPDAPDSLAEAIVRYRAARKALAARFGLPPTSELEVEAMRVF